MARLQITAAGQWWSTTNGWFAPKMGKDWPDLRSCLIGVHVAGALTNGTKLLLRRRKQAKYSDTGVAGDIWSQLSIDASAIAARGGDGMSDDFYPADGTYEYDIGCPTTFGAGDTVYVELS